MRNRYRTWMLCGLVLASFSAQAMGPDRARRIPLARRRAGGDVTNPGNWLEQPDPDIGHCPGPAGLSSSFAGAIARRCRSNTAPPTPLTSTSCSITPRSQLTSASARPSTARARSRSPKRAVLTDVNVKSIETQGGHRVSTVNANVNSHGLIEARNGHDLVFNGSVTVPHGACVHRRRPGHHLGRHLQRRRHAHRLRRSEVHDRHGHGTLQQRGDPGSQVVIAALAFATA